MKLNNNKKNFFNPLRKAQMAIFADRLKTSPENASLLLENLKSDIADILEVTNTGIKTSTEFYGRELDLLFTINKQNTPRKK
ncbi:MAG: hypothetical protein ACQETH_01170 [Candidatus Rifleibacteriota bacterium]